MNEDQGKGHNGNQIDKIELLIDKKIAEAKLVVAEKRLNHLLTLGAAFLAIFGTFIPLFLTQQSTNRADSAIEKMERKFEELAGKQLRKPVIACFVDGKPLANSILHFDRLHRTKDIVVKNIGNADANYIKVKLYIKNYSSYFSDKCADGMNWRVIESDNPQFNNALIIENDNLTNFIVLLLAQDSVKFSLSLNNRGPEPPKGKTEALLVIFYGEPTGLEVPFTFEFEM
ncbi:MAG: hypothetical protein M0P70_09060 [Desulfobulbaceae bacterium]|nr:hypothetical protein [Desulfobulbaceae bacterium]